MCSETERLDMLIVLNISSFLMSNVSDNMSLVLVTLKLSDCTISAERYILNYLWVNFIFNCITHLMVYIRFYSQSLKIL